MDQIAEYEKFNQQLHTWCVENVQNIYLPEPHMICAIFYDNTWCRGRIISRLSTVGHCEVFLIDFGIITNVTWRQLNILAPEFIEMNEATTQCSLADIEPVDDINGKWSEESISSLKRLAPDTSVEMFICKVMHNYYSVSLFIVTRICNITLNGLMVEQGFAKCTGPESETVRQYHPNDEESSIEDVTVANISMGVKRKQLVLPKKKESRSNVKLAHIISPGEFYITLTKYAAGIEKLQFEIQKYMQEKTDRDSTEWKLNDKCLARSSLKNCSSKSWYRGRIIMAQSDSCFVFLRDLGFVCQVPIDDIVAIDAQFDGINDGTSRCHLACVQPTGGSAKWSSAANEQFELVANRFSELAASIQGATKDDSLSVVLWGMSCNFDDPLASASRKWININQVLVNSGYVHLIEKFNPIDDVIDKTLEKEMNEDSNNNFDKWLSEFNAQECKPTDRVVETENDFNEYDVFQKLRNLDLITDNSVPITRWLDAIPIEKTIFTGVPTYVDNNGIIYLYDTTNKYFMEHMKTVINNRYNGSEPDLGIVWQTQSPCIAQYHLDGLFYRAKVLRIKSIKEIKVSIIPKIGNYL